jgi:hypothetical protein
VARANGEPSGVASKQEQRSRGAEEPRRKESLYGVLQQEQPAQSRRRVGLASEEGA